MVILLYSHSHLLARTSSLVFWSHKGEFLASRTGVKQRNNLNHLLIGARSFFHLPRSHLPSPSSILYPPPHLPPSIHSFFYSLLPLPINIPSTHLQLVLTAMLQKILPRVSHILQPISHSRHPTDALIHATSFNWWSMSSNNEITNVFSSARQSSISRSSQRYESALFVLFIAGSQTDRNYEIRDLSSESTLR